MPNLTQMAKGHNIAIGESAALLACFFAMGMDTTALNEMSVHTPSQEVSIVVECDTDTDCMRVVYSTAYRTDENAMNFLNAANIEVVQKEFAPDKI